jgi:hypothetical protein
VGLYVPLLEFNQEWGAVGFRSGFMFHKLDWLHDLDIEYDASTFDPDPFEPQPEGSNTIFPFWIPKAGGGASVESGVIPLAILRNGLRIFIIGQLCVRVSPGMIDSYVHRHGGPIFFAMSLIPFFLLLVILRKSESKSGQADKDVI